MKLIRRFTFLSGLLLLLMSVSGASVFAQEGVRVFRLYNLVTAEHLYTTSEEESNSLQNSYWVFEGVGWYAPEEGDPVYRLYNPTFSNHLYTTSVEEVQALTTQDSWIADNNGLPVFSSGGPIAIYRLYNGDLNALHHLTSDQGEYNALPALGWSQEGISIQAVGNGEPIAVDENALSLQLQISSGLASLQAEYPQGMHWSYEKYYTSPVLGSGNACHAFAVMASDKLFGNAPAREHTDINNIKVGDLIRYRSYSGGYVHSVIAMGVNGHQVAVAEGNWLRSVNYGRILNLDDRDNSLIYISTRY